MRLLSFVLGIVGNATAILVQLSPVPTFWLIIKRKTTGSFSSQPYLFSLFSGMVWTYYGFLSVKQGGIPVITISAVSSAFQLFYLALYMWFGSKSQRIKTSWIFVTVIGSFAAIVVVTMRLAKQSDPVVTIGIMCIVSGALSNAAPLTIMVLIGIISASNTHRVIKTASVEYMPFTLSLCLFLNGATWLAYSLSLKDVFLLIPNAIGVSLGAVQLGVYTFYKIYGVQS